MKKFENVPYNIQICNFGTSHGNFGYRYDDYEKEYTCFNFALNGQMLPYDDKILNVYKDHIAKDGIVFITVSYMTVFGASDEGVSGDSRYYLILPPHFINNYNLFTDLTIHLVPVLSVDFRNLTTKPEEIINEFGMPVDEITADMINLDYDAHNEYIHHLVNDRKEEDGTMIVKEDAVEAIYDMIDVARSVGARPVLVTTPYLHQFTDEIDADNPNFYEQFYGIIDTIKEDTGVEYYDFSHDERFCNDLSLFWNSNHLNKYGAVRFTDALIQETIDNCR